MGMSCLSAFNALPAQRGVRVRELVIGVHGSNMLLPTAHAGSLVELIGPERWGNFTQDVLFREAGDCRETFFRYRFCRPRLGLSN